MPRLITRTGGERDIANENGYEASIYDDENEMVITISPKRYSMGVAA